MVEEKFCNWCGRKGGGVKRLFPGPVTYICNICIERMAGVSHGEDVHLTDQVREEIDQAVQDSFKGMVKQLNLGPLQDSYQRLMRVKFKEELGSPTFTEVFQEFKKGVEAEVALDDYQTRYDLAIAYHEMGLSEDAFREMFQSLRGAMRQKDYDRAGEVMAALLYFHGDSARVVEGIRQAMVETATESRQ